MGTEKTGLGTAVVIRERIRAGGGLDISGLEVMYTVVAGSGTKAEHSWHIPGTEVTLDEVLR